MLRRERELRQISLREIAEATKISLRYLDSLEKDDFKHLPGGVFNKGFVRAYAQFIGVDPETMVTAYLEEEQRQQAEARHEAAAAIAAAAPAPEASEVARSAAARWWLAALALIIVLLVLAGLTFLGFGPLASRVKGLRSDAPAVTAATAKATGS
ncbi:MAG TPA: helix-turn-helix transcriptional regulator [Candidatus Polarisedimenticolaceae bacterium]|nr:helix-turn-helix transcriptional regulator [Candidatus Polarisedimenticolaceae bacterium]